MSDYKHRMSLSVPQALIAKANQLTLIVGESSDDDKTFTHANWQDKDGNLYAVCSTVIKPVVLSMFGISLSNITLPTHAVNADVTAAQQALDMLVLYDGTQQVSTDSIMCAVDYDPLPTLEAMGLSVIELEEIV